MASKRKRKLEKKAYRELDKKMSARRDAFNDMLWKYGPATVGILILLAFLFFVFYEPAPISAEEWSLEEAQTGDMYSSEDYYNDGLTFVEFFNSRCGHCNDQAPELNEIYETYKDNDQFNMFSIGGYSLGSKKDTKNDISSFKSKHSSQWPHLYDPSGELMRDYGFSTYPSMILIKEGKIVYSHSGELTAEALSAHIDEHLES